MSEDTAMLNKCLDFCQALVSQGQKFSFSLTTGSTFSFSLDTMKKSTILKPMKVNNQQEMLVKKKLSPSQVRRNMKRKEDFLKRKSVGELLTLKCYQCEKLFTSETDLKIHIDNAHMEEDDTENIVQVDGNDEIKKAKKETISTFKFVSEMTEEEREAHEKKQEEEAKANGSWCYE